MRHPDPTIQAARDEAAYARYDAELKALGEVLKTKFPVVPFKYDEPSKMWLTEDWAGIELLHEQFDYAYTDYLPNWRKFLGFPKLLVLGHDCDAWFGFTID